MRRAFIETKSLKTAKKRAPWASRFAAVCGGFMAFESIYDYTLWMAK